MTPRAVRPIAIAAALTMLVAPCAAQAQDRAAEYAALTERATTLPLTPDDIRTIGRRELDRTLAELQEVMAEVGFEGSTEEFFAFLRDDDRFYHPDTEEGRAAYLEEARRLIAGSEARLGEVIDPPPTLTALDVAPLPPGMPPFISAMYVRAGMKVDAASPALETGTLFFNLADMRSAPRFQLPALVYHEGVPGHHLQVAIERAPPRPPEPYQAPIRAYVEGWAAYAALRLPVEQGLYEEPYANAGRLAVEAWGDARLLVDVGLHVDGWTRDDAIAFLLANTALSEREAGLEVERCMERPAATSVYIIGMLEFIELRARAEAALGDAFDLRAFHKAVLGQGQLTLPELDDSIDRWIADQAAAR